MKNNIITITLLSLALSGCSIFGGQKEPITVTEIVRVPQYIVHEDVSKPNPLVLDTIQYVLPRDLSADKVVKNTTKCKDLDPKDKSTPVDCLEYPVINNTNVFLGLDQDNFNKLIKNFGKTKAQEKNYIDLIDMVNKQRQESRDKNETVNKE